jgi:Histidine kinase
MHSRDFAYAEGLSTADDLPAVRARLIAAGDEESRRIERALHDGVQQDLIAVSVRLQLARRLVASDLPAATAFLGEIEDDVRKALDRVRSLANEIYPSVLEAQGLPAALRRAAFTTSVEAQGVGRYRPDVERAVFFLCRAFALSGASMAIRIREEGGELLVAADCETAAFAAEEAFAVARDRIDALGGVVGLESTRVTATVPLA